MKIMKYVILTTLFTLIFIAPVFANNETDPKRADEWFIKERLKSPAPKNKKPLEEYVKEGQERLKTIEEHSASSTSISGKSNTSSISNKSNKIPRYIMLFKDDDYIYWLDAEALRWLEMPYSVSEDMVDCWVKIEDVSEDKEYSYPEKYYMEHLYLRPAKRQVMFLSELEVTGRPENNIKERTYRPDFWEELVPNSVEQEIYKGTLEVLKLLEKKHKVKPRSNKEKYNFFEDTLGIAGIF